MTNMSANSPNVHFIEREDLVHVVSDYLSVLVKYQTR